MTALVLLEWLGEPKMNGNKIEPVRRLKRTKVGRGYWTNVFIDTTGTTPFNCQSHLDHFEELE